MEKRERKLCWEGRRLCRTVFVSAGAIKSVRTRLLGGNVECLYAGLEDWGKNCLEIPLMAQVLDLNLQSQGSVRGVSPGNRDGVETEKNRKKKKRSDSPKGHTWQQANASNKDLIAQKSQVTSLSRLIPTYTSETQVSSLQHLYKQTSLLAVKA